MMTIKELNKLFKTVNINDLPKIIALYKTDVRSSVKALIKRAENQIAQHKRRSEKLVRLAKFDEDILEGSRWIVGVDEAGRGPLAGPVVAAACIIKPHPELIGLDDSKKLTVKERERLYDVIITFAKSYAVAIVEPAVIDKINILEATKYAMQKVLISADKYYDVIITDCVDLKGFSKPLHAIVKGDQKSLSVAAASVLAKVTRDRLMLDYHKQYPDYGFDAHKGYGTAQHYSAIRQYGITEIHRKSFLTRVDY